MMMRLERAITLSVALHLGIALMTRNPVETARISDGGPPELAAISVFLTPPAASKNMLTPPDDMAQQEIQRPILPSAVAAHTREVGEPGVMVQRARFLVDPDLSPLETMPVGMAGQVVLLLAVSHLGTVSSVTLASGDPMPSDLLAAISNVFARAQLRPALDKEGRPLDSSLKIVVRFEPNQLRD